MKLKRWSYSILAIIIAISIVLATPVAQSTVQAVSSANSTSSTDSTSTNSTTSTDSASSTNSTSTDSTSSQSSTNSQNLIYPSFTADYYLDRAADNTSTLHVVETIVAEFPNANQKHGITRTIPRVGRHNAPIVDNQSALNLTITRNGNPEPIGKITEADTEYIINIGDANTYVHGTQTYVLEYDFTDVIAELTSTGYDVSGKQDATVALQQLYLDTNGTEWDRSFAQLTANLHLPDDIRARLDPEETTCFVGEYNTGNASAQARCKIERTSDGYTFSAQNLDPRESLTLAVNFQPDTFDVVIKNNYILLIVFLIGLLIAGLILTFFLRRWFKKSRANYQLYKSTFVAPQYLPPADLTVAEGAHVYINYDKHADSTCTATLLEMAVRRRITIKTLDRSHWSVILNVDPKTLTIPERNVLQVLADTSSLTKGTEIPIKKHPATESAQSYAEDYKTQSRQMAVDKGYLVDSDKAPMSPSDHFAILFAIVLLLGFLLSIIRPLIDSLANNLLGNLIDKINPNAHLVGEDIIPSLSLFLIILFPIVIFWLDRKTYRFGKYTAKGVSMARYLDGLEQYIKLAEDKRLAFLQSVQGVDVSAAGLVHLYEKLLPWASLFGVEKSWASELNRYYEAATAEGITFSDCICDPSFLDCIIIGNIISDINHNIASYRAGPRSRFGSGPKFGTGTGSLSSSGSGTGGGGFAGGGIGGGGGSDW